MKKDLLKPIASHKSVKVVPQHIIQGYSESTQSGDVATALAGTKETEQSWTEDNDY